MVKYFLLSFAPDPPNKLFGSGLCYDCAILARYHKLRLGRSLVALHDPALERQNALLDWPMKDYVKVCGNEHLSFLEDGHRREA
jgi:hypothetical protein